VPILAMGALSVAGLGLAGRGLASLGSEHHSRPVAVPAGASTVAVAFTNALLAAECGHDGAIKVLGQTATPTLARSVIHALATRTGPPALSAWSVSGLGVVAVGEDEARVLVEAWITGPGADRAGSDGPGALAWPLDLKCVAGRWLVSGVGGRWAPSGGS
jgi:hypothetical protein